MPGAQISENHPLRALFQGLIHDTLSVKMGLPDRSAENYLCRLVTDFVHTDSSLLSWKDKRMDDIVEMLEHGDVLLAAESFDQERIVHKHIGDYFMFWAGVFPEHLTILRKEGRPSGLIDHVAQGKASYHLVSTFTHGDFAREAPLYKRLSEKFETYLLALQMVRESWVNDERRRMREFGT